MPLCTLEIPHNQWANIPLAERKASTVSVCNKALDQVLEGLKIPNLEDREVRVLRGQISRPRMSISFTVGPNEYPDFPGKEVFSPSAELIHAVGVAAQKETGKSFLGAAEVRMESWSNTTFIIVDRSAEIAEPATPAELENEIEIENQIDKPKVTLVISPEAIGGGTHFKEGESLGKSESYSGVAREIYRALAETFGFPEGGNGQTEILIAEYSDARFSVEFDCQPREGFLIPESVRQFAARKVEKLLNTNSLTREGLAEAWIRQGKPAIDVIRETVLGNTGFGR